MGQSGARLRSNKDEDGGDDVKRQVDSDDNHQLPIYQLVNVKNGGGKLVDIIKSGAKYTSGSLNLNNRSTDLVQQMNSTIDKQIHDLIEPLLYNGGRGKLVALSKIWRYRFGMKSVDVEDEETPVPSKQELSSTSRYRWVCWKLEERGHVGETALHICFLLSTPTHMILARKLLSMFPMLVNDIYVNDRFFGESSLHMAIVSENVRIVKLLLDNGANVHERCLGCFFLPFDQDDRANGTIRKLLANSDHRETPTELEMFDLQSNQFSSLDTNYEGYAYWGEYPLSFAACLGLIDCYKLLLAKGANPNRQDSNGNSTLHTAVIANRIDMFDLCYANGANLNMLNKQNLSPLTLAAKLERVEMFFHILTIQRQVNWIFCDVGFVEVPLAGIDSVNPNDGCCDFNSVLSIVVFKNSTNHLQMLDGLVGQLLQIKWETSIKQKFSRWFAQYVIFMITCLVAYFTRLAANTTLNSSQGSWFNLINITSELLVVLNVTYYLWIITKRMLSGLSIHAFLNSLAQAPEIFLFLITCILVLFCIPLRFVGWRSTENFLAAIIMFSLPLKMLFFCRASRSVGSFVVMIYKILVNDVLCFVVFMVIFVAGFSQSFLIMFKTHKPSLSAGANQEDVAKNYFISLFDGIISMHMMALNEFGIVVDELDQTDYPVLAKLLFCVYMVLVSILLINMLIAMLGKTYQDIASQPNENLRQWARALLFVERISTKQDRLTSCDKYSHAKQVASSKARFYSYTWVLTQRDREELRELKLLYEENRRSLARLARLDKTTILR